MEIKVRKTYGFIELKVDEIECIIFEDSKEELQDTIDNLEEVIEKLKSYLD